MAHSWTQRRHGAPEDPAGGGLALFGFIAAAGFAVGWLAQALGSF